MEQIRLDLIPGKSAPVCHASQYDVGRTIRLNLVEGGSEYSIPSGTTAEIHIRKPDNNIISAAVTATQGNKYIDIVTAEQWTACAGTNLCEIVLTNGGNVIGTINFILEVEMDPIDGGSASESVIYNIQALVDTAVALHTFLIHITENTMTESAADILGAINSNKILQVIYKPDANNLATHILPLTLDSGARPDGIRALAFAGFWGSKLYAADIVLDSIHSTVASLSMTNGKDLDETGDFPIHIHNSTITETAGEVLDAMSDGLKPYVVWTNNAQPLYTFTYVLAAVWDLDATARTLIFGCPITGAVRTIQIYINPTTRTYSSSISIVDYNIPQINDSSTSSSSVWSSQKTASELAGKAEIDDTAVSSSTAWSSEQIVSLLPTESASGAVANFSTPLTLPLVSHNVTIDYKDTTGYTEANITKLGKNWINVADYNAALQTTKQLGGFPKGQFVLSFDLKNTTNIGGTLVLQKKNTSSALATRAITANEDARVEMPFNLDSYTEIQLRISGSSAGYRFEFKRTQLEYGATATDYEAYTTPTNYEINLGGTIYGGSVDVTNGTVTSTKAQDGTDLPDPVVTTIDPTVINTLKGVNNIWADTGDTAVEFKQDIQTYIDSRLSSGTRSLSLAKAPVETEETKQEEQEGDESLTR